MKLPRAIAIDFDGCLCEDKFPYIGNPNIDIINRAKAEIANGAKIILWTCREGELLNEAIRACEEWGLELSSVNESLDEWIQYYGTRPRKIGADEYWDDKAVRVGE